MAYNIGLRPVRQGRVEISVGDGVALLRMNRPEKRNAIDPAQIDALESAVAWLQEAPEVRAAVLTGHPEAFCAGGDIAMFEGLDGDTSLAFTRRGYDLLRPLETGEIPVIAAVNGYCIAGGLEIALACDLVIAGESARLGFGEVDLGLIPGWGGTVRLAKAVPVRMARQLTLTCERITAAEAQRMGLVNEVVADDDVVDRALALAGKIAAQPPHAVRATKTVVAAVADGADTDTALALERSLAAALFGTTTVRKQVRAWLDSAR